jgi:outer membrane receptor protein involved in Fe transport
MAKKYVCVLLVLLCIPFASYAQQATVKGKVINGKSRESLPGVNVTVSVTHGVATDIDGNYSIKVDPGRIRLTYSFMGFRPVTKNVDMKAGDVITENISMFEESMEIEGVVVSAGKFEQKLSDVTISMAVLKPTMLENQNINDATEALRKIPGLDITDGQPSIRGGSGYSYGAGSRVLLLVDDLPILTPDAGDAKWNFIPLENISQIEVLKGASSALFGSSALNGVINVRTAFPTDKPVTKFSVNNGIHLNPKRKELIWWGSDRPGFAGMNFMHSQKFGQFDMVIGANGFRNNSFRESESETRGRVNANLRYRNKKVKGLSYGLNTNFMFNEKTDFFLWQDADSGAWRQNTDAISINKGIRFNIDPYLVMFNKRGAKHSVRTRYFIATNYFEDDPAKDNSADMVYGEYQFHQKIRGKFDLTTGISGTYGESKADLFGSHFSINASAYLQLDFRFWDKLGLSLGARLEYFRIDTAETESTYALYFTEDTLSLPVWPVFRIGLNYHLFKYTFLRGSFGQGYRFPTIAEKFVKASVGGLNLFPNPQLKPETGWNAELGIKQGIKLGNWNGYLDLAGFWTEYSNMMEFTFGIWDKPADSVVWNYIGFKSVNVGRARITGFDFTFTGEGNFFGFPATLLIGYTYTNPVDLVKDSGYIASKSTADNILKYRNYHSVKGDFEVSFGRYIAGISYVYASKMVNIDKKFEERLIPELPFSPYILPGLKEYREKHDKGYHVLDARVGFMLTENMRFSLLVKNLLNREYMVRPGLIEAPRNVAIQFALNL